MLALIQKIGLLLPVLAALNVALSAIGGVADSISKAKGGDGASGLGKMLGQVCGVIKKVIDLISGNLPH